MVLALSCLVWAGCNCQPTTIDVPDDDAAERYAEAICEAHERCGCMGLGFDDRESCVSHSVDLFETVASVPGMEFRSECFEDVLDHIDSVGCGGLGPDTFVPCATFVGTLGTGDRCNADWLPVGMIGGLTDGQCRNEGTCVGGSCTRPPSPEVGLGEPCHWTLGTRCGSDAYCNSDGLCAARVDEGQECDSPAACGFRQFCAGLGLDDELGVCQTKIPLGSRCDPEDTWPCDPDAGLDGYCSPDGLCVDSVWPAVCELAHIRPGWYDPTDWIPAHPPR